MDNKILIGGAALAAIVLMSKKGPNKTPIVIDTSDNAIILNDGPSMAGIGTINITRDSEPSYNTWKRPQWAAFYKDLYKNTTPQNAGNVVWSYWNDSNNQSQDYFNDKQLFVMNLATYQPTDINGIYGVITEDSIPVYDTWANWWNNVTAWTCDEWRLWYDMNKNKYGKASTDSKFVSAWNSPDNWGGYGNLGMGNKCGMTCDFVNYFRTKGIDVATFGTTTTCTLISVPGNLIDAAANTTKGIKDATSLASTVLPVAIVGGALYVIYKNSTK